MVEPLVLGHHFCDTQKNVQGGGYNREKDVEAMSKKLNYLALGVRLRRTHTIIFVMITGFGPLFIYGIFMDLSYI